MNIRRFRRIRNDLLMLLLLTSAVALSSCSTANTADQQIRSRVSSVGVQANGNVNTGDLGGEVVVTLRDPNGLAK